MKKWGILISLVILFSMLLCGCSIKELSNTDKTFKVYERYDSGRIIIDKETHVMYWAANRGGLTLLLDRYGRPKIFEEADNEQR